MRDLLFCSTKMEEIQTACIWILFVCVAHPLNSVWPYFIYHTCHNIYYKTTLISPCENKLKTKMKFWIPGILNETPSYKNTLSDHSLIVFKLGHGTYMSSHTAYGWRPLNTFNTAAAVRAAARPLRNRNDRFKIPVDAAAAMWRINPLKIYPDLSPLFIICLNSAVNRGRSSG